MVMNEHEDVISTKGYSPFNENSWLFDTVLDEGNLKIFLLLVKAIREVGRWSSTTRTLMVVESSSLLVAWFALLSIRFCAKAISSFGGLTSSGASAHFFDQSGNNGSSFPADSFWIIVAHASFARFAPPNTKDISGIGKIIAIWVGRVHSACAHFFRQWTDGPCNYSALHWRNVFAPWIAAATVADFWSNSWSFVFHF